MMEVSAFSDIEHEFIARVQRYIWCNMATVDEAGRPRSRIVHPLWKGSEGWVTTRRHSYKGRHLAQNPHVSLAYVSDLAKPVYVDCVARWVDDLEEKQKIWDFVKNTPEPVGFDPAPLYGTSGDPGFGVLHLEPWRIELVNLPNGKPQVWHVR